MSSKIALDKTALVGFVNRYYLGGLGKSVVWVCENGKLTTDFMSDNHNARGNVSFKKFPYPEAFKLGIYNTDKFTRVIAPLDEKCEFAVEVEENEAKSLDLTDGNMLVHFMLSALDIIPTPATMKQIPKWDAGIKLTKELIERFTKGVGALPDVGTFTVRIENGSARLHIGYTSIDSDAIVINAEVTTGNTIAPLTFHNAPFREIFAANKDASQMKFDISERGLAKLEFESDMYKSLYYVVTTDEVR